MAIISVDPEIVSAPQVRALIGIERAGRFRREHPLFEGLAALSQFERRVFTPNLAALWQLESDVRAIITYLSGRGFDGRVGDDLSSEDACRALLFESRIEGLLLERYVDTVTWRRYEESASDFLTDGPRLQIECTQVRDYDLEAMRQKVTSKRKRRQRRVGEGPYVLVVGTNTVAELHIYRDLGSDLRRALDAQLASHRDVAAVYFCAPQPLLPSESAQWIDDETFTYRFCHYTGFTVRNLRADEPLPADFEQNWTMQAAS